MMDQRPAPGSRRALADDTCCQEPAARVPLSLALLLVALMALPASARAQGITFSITEASISFADADPDTTPSLTASSNVTLNYRVTGNGGGNWQITVISGTDLTSGTATIPISNVTWTAAPVPPFQAGTMSTSVPQTVASGSGNANSTTGTMVFRLINSWSYNVGNYNATFTFTMTAP